MRVPLRSAALVAVVLVTACGASSRPAAPSSAIAQAGEPSAARRCAPATVDSSFAAYGVVHRNCDVDRPARLTAQPRFDRTEVTAMTAARRPQTQCHSAVVEFVVDETGHPIVASARVVRSTGIEAAKAVMRMVPGLRYEPALKDGSPVRQLATHGYGTAMVVRSGTGAPGRPPRC